ncbi:MULTISPECIES: hypothetical protein [unclassified Mesorhizobium]|nr:MULTISPECIES: hypothetical protein [unclassified Mesorhizobium]
MVPIECCEIVIEHRRDRVTVQLGVSVTVDLDKVVTPYKAPVDVPT